MPSATSVRVRGGEALITDGPFAETKVQLWSFYLVEAADLDTVLAACRTLWEADHGTVEIRPLIPMPAAAPRRTRPRRSARAALLLAHDARREARIGADGRSVPLDRQDRSRYDAARIEEAAGLLDRALALRRSGPYQLQAAIAVLHARAPTAADTDWPQIAALYGALARAAPSPVVALNRAGASRPRRPARGARRPPMTS